MLAQPHRKLFFLNLANDVIQTGKKKGEEFTNEFEKVLPDVFENTFKLDRLTQICWGRHQKEC
jgi:hypothetical protein